MFYGDIKYESYIVYINEGIFSFAFYCLQDECELEKYLTKVSFTFVSN